MVKTNLHIYPSPITHESRMMKETATISRLGIVDKILIIGIWDEGLLEEEKLDQTRTILRIKLWSRKLGEGTLPKSIKFAEWTIRIAAKFILTNVTLVNVHNPAVLPLGGAFKLLKRAKLIYDTHELESERYGWSKSRRVLAKLIERALIRLVDEIIVVSPSIGDWYEKRYAKRTFAVLNTQSYKPATDKGLLREKLEIAKDKTIFIYQGSLSSGRGIENLLEAFIKGRDRDRVIVFMGFGPLEPIIKLASLEFDNIYFHPPVAPEVIVNYTSSGDAGFVLFESACLSHYLSLPNKFFEYAMAGVPIIVTDLPEMKRLVESYGIGYVIKDNSVEEITGVMDRLDRERISTFKHNLASFNKIYNWETQEETLSSIYNGL